SSIEKLERNKMVVNMYKSGHTIDDIWKVSGFKSRSSIFRILNDVGVDLNRGNTKGPIKKRNTTNL
ncbi:MAG: recombinase family protein, partial [Bacteroidales bacterium]